MVRPLLLAVILLLSIGLAHWASTKILYQVDVVSFSWGLGVAALTAWAWMMLHGWWSAVTKPFKPLKVTLETKETSAQVNFCFDLGNSRRHRLHRHRNCFGNNDHHEFLNTHLRGG
jgi:hypothetical protein